MNNTKSATVNQVRQPSGQFGHGLDAVCKCGRRKGEHDAERPFPYDGGDGQCAGFKIQNPEFRGYGYDDGQ